MRASIFIIGSGCIFWTGKQYQLSVEIKGRKAANPAVGGSRPIEAQVFCQSQVLPLFLSFESIPERLDEKQVQVARRQQTHGNILIRRSQMSGGIMGQG